MIFLVLCWVVPLKDKKKKDIAITDAFQTILNKYGCIPNKV